MGIQEQTLTAVLRLRDEMSSALAGPKSALSGLSTTFSTLQAAATKALGVITGGVVLMSKSVIDTAEQLDVLSKQTGVSVESLQKLAFVGQQAGVGLGEIGTSLNQLGRHLADARNGSMQAVESFRLLGVSVDELRDPSTTVESLFLRIADSMQYLNNSQKEEVFKVMGRGAMDLIPLLSQGSAAILALGDAAKDTGAVMSTQAVQGLSEFGRQTEGMGAAIKGMFGELLASQTVSIPAILDGIGQVMKVINGLKSGWVYVFQTIGNALVFAGALIKDTFMAIADFIALSMAKVVSAVAEPLLKLSTMLEENGIYDPFKGMRASLQAWVTAANSGSLSDPFRNLAANVKQDYAAMTGAQDQFTTGAQNDYKDASASVDQFIGKLKQAAALQTSAGQKSAVSSVRGGKDAATTAMDDILALNGALEAANGLSEEMKKKLADAAGAFQHDNGIALTTEQMNALAGAIKVSDKAFQDMLKDIKAQVDSQPLSGLQEALFDLSKQTYNFRTGFLKIMDDIRDGISNALASAIDGTQKFSDAFKQVGKQLLKDLTKMFTDFATQSIFSGLGGGLLGLFGGGSNAPGTVNNPLATLVGAGSGSIQTAQGGSAVNVTALGSAGGGLAGMLGLSSTTLGAVTGLGAAGAALTASGVSNGNRTQGALGGALAGASLGAVVGSVIPGIGTLIGGVAGGIIGGIAGFLGSSAARRRKKRQQEAAQRAAEAAYQAALVQARIVLKADIRNKLGGGAASLESAHMVSQLFSGDLSADEIAQFGNPSTIAANAAAVAAQSQVNNVSAPITVQATISGSYDVAKLASDLSYHIQAQMGGAASGL